MKTFFSTLICFALAIVVEAAPPLPDQIELRTTMDLAADAAVGRSSMFNPRLFDGNIYANQINTPAVGRYPSKSAIPNLIIPTLVEHRMIAPFRGANAATYILGASGATTMFFTRYDATTGETRVDAPVPGDAQTAEGFDWVDENTIIYTTYNPSANRRRLSLATVVAEPFTVTSNTRWNASGFVATSATVRIRNVRVGDVYNGYAYYGDNGNNNNPGFFALNLATGAETLLGSAGTLTGSGSFGVWTVTERGGYLYVQTSDNGIQVYNMTGPATLGSLHTTYSKARLDQLTGVTGQYFGFDASSDGKQMILGGAQGIVYELAVVPPVRRVTTFNLAADLGIVGNSIFNTRIFNGAVYVNQINTPGWGRYPLGSAIADLLVHSTVEHRMVAPIPGANPPTYIFGASGAATTTFSRYDFDGANRTDVPVPGTAQTSEGFDWVDDNTIIYTTYNPSANRRRLSLATVVAEPFAVTADTTWNANGYIATSASTRIRNVRVGDVYNTHAYYGDNGQNNNPAFYAINLATGAETLLGNLGALTGGGSFGLWTVTERGGRLFVQTTDNGIFVYKMNSATSLGALETTYTKPDLDNATGYSLQYWGFDVTPDGRTLVLGGTPGLAWELTVTDLPLDIRRDGADIVLSWPGSVTDALIEASDTLTPPSFDTLDPQPLITIEQGKNTARLPIGAGNMFFRLRR